jgi:hypothetical protein
MLHYQHSFNEYVSCIYLTNRKQFRKGFFIEPVALYDQVIPQNGHVCLRSTKRHQSERPKRGKDCKSPKKSEQIHFV